MPNESSRGQHCERGYVALAASRGRVGYNFVLCLTDQGRWADLADENYGGLLSL